jgi:hypothetical protein
VILAGRGVLAGAVAVLVLAGAGAGPAAGEWPPPRSRTYSAVVIGGSGRFAHAHGAARIVLTLHETGVLPATKAGTAARYEVQIELRGARCAMRTRRCLRLSGLVAGEAVDDVREPFIADLPAQIRIVTLAGSLKPLGAVSGHGDMAGLGFVPRGRRSLSLVLATSAGDVYLHGLGPVVPGFSAP